MSPAAQTSPPSDEYVWMVGWERFQTFQTKRGKLWTPPWIKVYTDLLDNPDYIELTPRRRSILHGLWLVFGRCSAGGRLVLGSSPAKIGRIIADDSVRKRDVEALNHAGWIDLCSRTVLEQRWVAFWNCSGREVEKRREEPSVVETNPVSTTAAELPDPTSARPVEAVDNLPANRFVPSGSPDSAQGLTAEFVDACRDADIEAPRRVIGQMAQATRRLLDEGIGGDAIRNGYRRMVQRGMIQPTMLPNFVAEASIPSGLRAVNGRGLTPSEILARTQEAQ